MNITRFDHIALGYEEAMSKYPDCRMDHTWLLEKATQKKAKNVLEVSGGTGFLTEKIVALMPEVNLVVQDVSEAVLKINANKNKKLNSIEYYLEDDMHFPKLQDNTFDCIINLGGFHHIEDQITFFKNVYRILDFEGSFYVGDFIDNSPIQKYFDEKINFITSTGHQGLFASESRLINLARFSGFKKFSIEVKKIPFCFNTKKDIGNFFQKVHDLQQDPEQTLKDIESLFDVVQLNNGYAVIIDYIYAWYSK